MAFIIPVIVIIFLIGHALLIENYRRWFLRVKPFVAPDNLKPSVKFTIIIPARNEEDNIGACLESILKQDYPKELYEVIVADDFSTDNTAGVVSSYSQQYSNVHLIQLEKLLFDKKLNSYKKKAIDLAIQQSTGDWIVTTDADCIVPNNWLLNFAGFIAQNNSVFVAAPVKFTNVGSFVSIFQSLDFISLQGITAASVNEGFHSMCNGANLAYKKEVFYEVGGFKGIDNIASGDDMLLMHKIFVRYPKQVGFLLSQSSIVETLPMNTWKAFINQRIRWASKADKFDDKRIFWVLVFIYLFNLSFIVLPILAFWFPIVLVWVLVMLVGKTIIDMRFMVLVATFFNQGKLLLWFPVMQPFHIVYTVVAGWLGKFGKYTWKGRTVK
ncbi:MAG: N-acetylglucosaminyltransferase [Segetibacter sp.]|nr:N-acetylglucosaminyltransferase [Segetibacter sp.]